MVTPRAARFDLLRVALLGNAPTKVDASGHSHKGALTGNKTMSKFERLLEAGSTELPDCRCAAEMNLMGIVPAGGDTEIRIFRCPNCSHELRLTAWRVSAA